MDKMDLLVHQMSCSTVFFKAEGRLEQFLVCLEETEGFMPTHFGIGDQSKFSYERQAAIAFIYENSEPVIWSKNKLVRYELNIAVNEGFNTHFRLDVINIFKNKMVPLFFALGEKLVQIAQPIWFTSYHVVRGEFEPESNEEKELESWMRRGRQTGYTWYCGFAGIGTISYMHNEIAQQFGMDYLKSAPAIVEELPNGLVRIALSEKPWEENWLDLVDKWMKVMTYLAQTGFVAMPHLERSYINVIFMMNQKGLVFKEAMRAKYLAEGKPVPSCFERHSRRDASHDERVFDAPYLIEVPGMKESERYVLEHIKKEEWI